MSNPLRYEQPPKMSRCEIESELASDDADRIFRALLAASYTEPAAWVEEQCFKFAAHPMEMARRTAALEVVGAAPAIGAGGTAMLAIPGELTELAIEHLAGNVLPGMEEEAAKAKLAQIAPKVLQIVKEWALPTSAVGGLLKLLSMGKGNK